MSLCTARGSDVKVNITLATDVDGTPVMSFSSDTATLYAMFKTQGVKAGDKVLGALIAEMWEMWRQPTPRLPTRR